MNALVLLFIATVWLRNFPLYQALAENLNIFLLGKNIPNKCSSYCDFTCKNDRSVKYAFR